MSYTIVYRDVQKLLDDAGKHDDDLLDDILELQSKFDSLNDRFRDLLSRMQNLNEEMEESIQEAKK